MMLPDYWLERPAYELDQETIAAFDHLYEQITSGSSDSQIDYRLAAPKWQFLCYLTDQNRVAFHGSGAGGIELFEPRQSNDLNEFGNQKAVYAAGDALWAMFFAIVDREHYPMSISNACIRLVDKTGVISQPFYVFSISQSVYDQRPWRGGFVYLLPQDTFISQSPLPFGEYEVRIPQLASFSAVRPLARLQIQPEDFPFLAQVRRHDDSRLAEYGQAMQSGGPWPE